VESFDVKKAAEILARMLDEKNRKLARTYSSIFGTWESIVGDSLAEHSRIYEIANGYLFVEVDHPGWMQLLLMKKPQILRAVKRKVKVLDVKDIRIKVNLRYSDEAPQEKGSPVDGGEREDKAAGEQHEGIDQILSSVSQEELKRRLKRLFLKSLENEKSDRG
jgi:hypothetical protein